MTETNAAGTWLSWPNFSGGTVCVTHAEVYALLCKALRRHQEVLVRDKQKLFKASAANLINKGESSEESEVGNSLIKNGRFSEINQPDDEKVVAEVEKEDEEAEA